ncbi:sigma-54-dependent Fis family transcriptional regulator [bacterium]|nr:sigma-54-dependent Fis family transcriptional regulator [candidate division CSSED10-310 bacterium]
MLIRVTLIIEDVTVSKRLQAILTPMDVLLSSIPIDSFSADMMTRENTDLIIIHRTLSAKIHNDDITVLRKHHDQPEILVVVNSEDAHVRARLIGAGVFAVLNGNLPDKELERTLRMILARRVESLRHSLEARRLVGQNRLSDFVSSSPVMNTFMGIVKRIVDTDATLLLLGETGVGKEHLARAIHRESRRSRGAFIAVNCGALPETLLESELFGHEEGAFTGATKSMRGQFEMAHRGTILLDEIAEMPLALQVKLLHVLEQRQIRRLGAEQMIPVDVRIMAATNRNLAEEIREKRFRMDLYYRLSALTLNIPPLRERREDIPELIDNYLAFFCATTGKPGLVLAPSALDAMIQYDWPGNVRELINVVERITILSTNTLINPDDLPSEISGRTRVPAARDTDDRSGVQATMLSKDLADLPFLEARSRIVTRFEQDYLNATLTKYEGRIGQAARSAGISSRTLFEKMKQLGLRKEFYKRNNSG